MIIFAFPRGSCINTVMRESVCRPTRSDTLFLRAKSVRPSPESYRGYITAGVYKRGLSAGQSGCRGRSFRLSSILVLDSHPASKRSWRCIQCADEGLLDDHKDRFKRRYDYYVKPWR